MKLTALVLAGLGACYAAPTYESTAYCRGVRNDGSVVEQQNSGNSFFSQCAVYPGATPTGGQYFGGRAQADAFSFAELQQGGISVSGSFGGSVFANYGAGTGFSYSTAFARSRFSLPLSVGGDSRPGYVSITMRGTSLPARASLAGCQGSCVLPVEIGGGDYLLAGSFFVSEQSWPFSDQFSFSVSLLEADGATPVRMYANPEPATGLLVAAMLLGLAMRRKAPRAS